METSAFIEMISKQTSHNLFRANKYIYKKNQYGSRSHKKTHFEWKTYEEISTILKAEHQLRVVSVRRFCYDNGIDKRICLEKNLWTIVKNEISEVLSPKDLTTSKVDLFPFTPLCFDQITLLLFINDILI